MKYYAHRGGDRAQLLTDHLKGTARLAECFADAFGAGAMGRHCGLLHDIGKYSDAFQRRLNGSSERVDHSTAGAWEAFARNNVVSAFCVAGHHGGLPDLGNKRLDTADKPTFFGRVRRGREEKIEPYHAYMQEMGIPDTSIPTRFVRDNCSMYFFTKMLFSCLVDADYLDTEAFCSCGVIRRGGFVHMPRLQKMLEKYISGWQNPQTDINRRRCAILQSLLSGGGGRGIYSLTVPTGGGKTIGSMAFALEHASKNRMRRVIYVIPYTSIIEQTQDVLGKIFGPENVVAHYADVVYDTDENTSETDRRRLAAENWDAPIVLTTAVQFFESIYSNRPSRCRKLHNIANSVIIFDEAQMLPVPFLRPCVAAITKLVRDYACTAVLCTATQPSLDPIIEEFLPNYKIRELCPDTAEMYQAFRRVQYKTDGHLDDAALAARLADEPQVLCIVNSRQQAQRVFSLLPEEDTFHLSTTLTPHDRRAVLNKIRERLLDGKPCRVVSTSLVEAGVDVDFPVVYRALSGLDSMLQAGGRCNREGKRDKEQSIVHLFETDQKPPDMLRQNIDAAKHVLRTYPDIASPEAIKAYFDFLYYKVKDQKELDKQRILPDIQKGKLEFRSIADRFRIIDSAQYTVYVPQENGAELIEQLRTTEPKRALLRKLGQFSVGVYPQLFSEMLQAHVIEPISENAAILCDMSLYHKDTGLALTVKEGNATFI